MVKKSVFYFLFLILSFIFIGKNSKAEDLREMTPAPPSALIQLMNIVTGDIKQWTWEEMHETAQKEFLRPKGKERWEITLNPNYEFKKSILLPLLKKLGVIDEVVPAQKYYTYIIVNGGTVFRMRNRLEGLQKLWRQGVRADKIVFFTSERPLDLNVEGDSVLYPYGAPPANVPRPNTEVEAAKLVWDQTITLPHLRAQDVEYVVVPMLKDPKTQKEIRPNAGHVIHQWLATKPQSGTILYIINNPYIPHQHRVFAKILEKYPSFTLETAGPAAGENSITNHLDNIARCIHTQVVGE